MFPKAEMTCKITSLNRSTDHASHSNYSPIMYHFWDPGSYWLKIVIFRDRLLKLANSQTCQIWQ